MFLKKLLKPVLNIKHSKRGGIACFTSYLGRFLDTLARLNHILEACAFSVPRRGGHHPFYSPGASSMWPGAHGSCSVQSRWSGIGRPVIMVKHLFHTVKVGHTGCENVMSKV